MYFDDHNPPHFHASYQGHEASFSFDGELPDGELPPKQKKPVVSWAAIHHDELLANWEIAQSDGDLFRIDPLR